MFLLRCFSLLCYFIFTAAYSEDLMCGCFRLKLFNRMFLGRLLTKKKLKINTGNIMLRIRVYLIMKSYLKIRVLGIIATILIRSMITCFYPRKLNFIPFLNPDTRA